MKSSSIFDHASIAPLFHAKSLAVIGASNHPLKMGGRPVLWSKLGRFPGKVYPISASSEEIHGFKAYGSILDVRGPIDCAFIALPAPAVEQAVRDCAAKGVKVGIIISAGFAETSEEGRQLQGRVVATARAAGMRLLGPNCMGAMNVDEAFFPLFYSVFNDAGKAPISGSLSLVSQSGAFGAHLFELALGRGVGFSKWVTTGNQADIEVADCVAFMAQDDATRTIIVYLEGSPNPARLMEALKLARSTGKPVVLLKSGKSEIGQKAAQSHTGALTGSDRAFDAMCRQAGAYRAETIDELLDIASACTSNSFPSKPQVGLVTISGGVGALMADYADELGLSVPPLPAHAQEKLLQIFPFGAVVNPVDPTGMWAQNTSVFGAALRALLDEGQHDAVVVFLSTAGLSEVEGRVREEFMSVRREFPDRLILISMLASVETRQRWKQAGLPVYEEPRRALEVVAALSRFGGNRAAHSQSVAEGEVLTVQNVGARFSELQATELLEKAGIPFAPRSLTASKEAAQSAARDMSFPVVLKLVSPDIAHKSEIGGVIANLADEEQVAQAYDLIMQRARIAAPSAELQGLLVARQVVGGVETILGVSQDPAAGTVVMFGIGGIFVEIYKDVVFRVAPISIVEAHKMIREVKGYALLAGARGKPPMDIDALARAISELSRFAAANADAIKSIDINPFIVLPRGEGGFGVDALVEPFPNM